MLGAIAGDIIGSVYEHSPIKSKHFTLFSPGCGYTDDTVLTIAVMDAIVTGNDYTRAIIDYTLRYPAAGFSGRFLRWAYEHRERMPDPYPSFGNGSAMRVSPVGYAFNSIDRVLDEARKSSEISHAHPEGIKGAQSVALSIFLARTGHGKETIRKALTQRFNYDLTGKLATIREGYSFDVTCQGSVPEAIICFLEAESVEDAIRNAVSLGGDSDTQACIAGAIAEAFFGGVPAELADQASRYLPLYFVEVIDSFKKSLIQVSPD